MQSKMKKLYLDRTECKDCVSVFVKDAQVIHAGTTMNPMSVKHRNAEYDRFAREYGIHFIFSDNVPAVDFYAVPQVEIFAADGEGGLLGLVRDPNSGDDDAAVVFIDKNKSCYHAASNLREFAAGAEGWRQHLRPFDGIVFYESKADAEKELEFVTPCEWK